MYLANNISQPSLTGKGSQVKAIELGFWKSYLSGAYFCLNPLLLCLEMQQPPCDQEATWYMEVTH